MTVRSGVAALWRLQKSEKSNVCGGGSTVDGYLVYTGGEGKYGRLQKRGGPCQEYLDAVAVKRNPLELHCRLAAGGVVEASPGELESRGRLAVHDTTELCQGAGEDDRDTEDPNSAVI